MYQPEKSSTVSNLVLGFSSSNEYSISETFHLAECESKEAVSAGIEKQTMIQKCILHSSEQ